MINLKLSESCGFGVMIPDGCGVATADTGFEGNQYSHLLLAPVRKTYIVALVGSVLALLS